MGNNKRPALFYNVVNGNGRMYTQDSIADALTKYNDSKHPTGVQYGELGHPDNIDFYRICQNPSHMINSVESNVEGLFIQVQPCTNADGEILARMLKEDMIVFRPRMIGNVDSNGIVTIEEIISFDAVPKCEDSYFEQQKAYDEKNKK